MSNPIQQAIEAIEQARTELEQYEEDATGEHYNSPRLNAALSALQSLQGVELPPLLPSDHPAPHTLVWTKVEIEAIQDYARAAVAAAMARGAVPQGWKLVPVEPTWDMKMAASSHYREPRDGHYTARMECAADAYRAMLSAAPTPEATQPGPMEKLTRLQEDMRLYDDSWPDAPASGFGPKLMPQVSGFNQPTQAEAPSDWSDTIQSAIDELPYQHYLIPRLTQLLAAQQAERAPMTDEQMRAEWFAAGGEIHGPRIETVTMPESSYFRFRRALATQQAGQGEAVAFEFYNPATGHAIVDYSRQTHVGPLTKEMGYEARPLGYVNPPPAAVKPSDPVPLWQALEALDSLEESSRGDAPYNHFAAGLIRNALEQAATPPAPQQPEALAQQERDREDAEPTDEQIDAAVSAWFKGPIMPGRQPFGERMRAAIRAARSSEGGSPSPSMVGREGE